MGADSGFANKRLSMIILFFLIGGPILNFVFRKPSALPPSPRTHQGNLRMARTMKRSQSPPSSMRLNKRRLKTRGKRRREKRKVRTSLCLMLSHSKAIYFIFKVFYGDSTDWVHKVITASFCFFILNQSDH